MAGRAHTLDGESMIVNVNGHYVPAVVNAVRNGVLLPPKLPSVEEVEAGLHPEVAAWIEEAPLTIPEGYGDTASPNYLLSGFGYIDGKRVALGYLCARDQAEAEVPTTLHCLSVYDAPLEYGGRWMRLLNHFTTGANPCACGKHVGPNAA
jgi:hypothetical protein